MSFKTTIGLLVIVVSLYACNRLNETTGFENPASEGFDLANSDPAAVELADSIMVAMGGWENWDNTRFISWNSFGIRNLIWDKKEERARIESLKDSTTYLVDLKTLTGKVFIKGQEVTRSDSLKKHVEPGKKYME